MENSKLNTEITKTDKQIFLNSISNFGNFLKSTEKDSLAYTKFTEDLVINHQKYLENFKFQILNFLNSNSPTLICYDTSNNLNSVLDILKQIKKPFDYIQILNDHYSPNKFFNKLDDLTNMVQLYQINNSSKLKRESCFDDDLKNENEDTFSFEIEKENNKQKKFDVTEEINAEKKISMNTLGTIVEQPSREENNVTNSENINSNNNINNNNNDYISNLINNNKIYSNENLLNSNINNNIYIQTISLNSSNKNQQITPKKDIENLFFNSNNKNTNSNLNINKIEKSPCFAPAENNLNSNIYINSFQKYTNTPMKNESEFKNPKNEFQYSFGEAVNDYKQSNNKDNDMNLETANNNVNYPFTTFKKENNANLFSNNFDYIVNSATNLYKCLYIK